jgi:hypothetical protein
MKIPKTLTELVNMSQACRRQLPLIFSPVFLLMPAAAFCAESDWRIGWYGGQYYNSEPAGILLNGNAKFLDQYLLAFNANKTVWRTDVLPVSLEIDGVIGQQFGVASVSEVAFAPVLRWSGFPWNEILHTGFGFAPFGVSYTVPVSPLERGKDGQGSQVLNFLLIELAFSLPEVKSKEVFVRLHHRCSIYDMLNNYGANGEDFLVLGYRRYF